MRPTADAMLKLSTAAGQSPDATSPRNSGRHLKKVRTGCVTCKARKVKCDETKPACIRCTKVGRACGGYFYRQDAQQQNVACNTRTLMPKYLALIPDLNKAREQQAFQFFQQVTAPMFALDFDSGFWKTIVLNLCHSKEAVRHAAIAVGSYHKSLSHYESGTSKCPLENQLFALKQYNKAIFLLRQELGLLRHEPILLLVMCILFVCIEFMQGNEVASIKHLQQGRQMLRQYVESGSLTQVQIELIRDNLVPLYLRSGSTAFLYGYTAEPLPDVLNPSDNVPLAFSSIKEAWYAFYSLMDRIMRSAFKAREVKYLPTALQEVVHALEAEQQTLLSLLSRWKSAFDVLQATEPDASACNPSVLILLIYCHATKIWMSTNLTPEETAYDQHVDSFSAILPLASEFLRLTDPCVDRPDHANHGRKNDSSDLHAGSSRKTGAPSAERAINSGSKPAFSFDPYVIPTLYFVAVKCRHPTVRRAALNLLEKNEHRQEGLWKARTTTRVAARFIQIESMNAMGIDPQASGTPPEPAEIVQRQQAPEAPTSTDSGSIPPPRMMHPIEDPVQEFDSPQEAFTNDLYPSSPQLFNPSQFDGTLQSPTRREDFSRMKISQSAHGSIGAASDGSSVQEPWRPDVGDDMAGLDNGQYLLPHNAATANSSGLPHQSSSESNDSLLSTSPPYGLPECSRVTDGVIGRQEGDGRWTKFFKKPTDPGGTWVVWEEHISIS